MAEGLGVVDLVSGVALSRRARTVIFGALTTLIVATLVMIYFGVVGEEKLGGWVGAATSLLGIIFPTLIIVAVLTLAEGGDQVVQNRTYAFMTTTLPRILRSIEEAPAALVPLVSLKRMPVESTVAVELQQYGNSCFGQYRLTLADGRVLRVEVSINVRKANVVLYVPQERTEGSDPQARFAFVRDRLKHSLHGAALEGYKINDVAGWQMMDGRRAVGLVLIRLLDPKFITSPYERVYFAQDLMFLLRSALNEAPALFAPDTPAA